jgi:hypothetical protein
MRKTKAQRQKHLKHVIAIMEDVCSNPLKWEAREGGGAGLWISQYDLDRIILLEQAGVMSVCFHTHAGFQQPEDLDIPRDDHSPVYLNVSITVR